MIEGRLQKDDKYDNNFVNLFKRIDEITDPEGENCDFIVFCTGERGSGKSMLSMHGQELYLKDDADLSFIGYNIPTFSTALQKAAHREQNKKKMAVFDEANISSRDAMKKINNEIIDMFYKIRGLNILCWWNNPSLEGIDKKIIRDLIRGVILITAKVTKKTADRPRKYYYFNKDALMQIYDKYESIDNRTLRKVKKKYSVFSGLFRDYTGKLRVEYDQQKDKRMLNAVDEFAEKYGEKKIEQPATQNSDTKELDDFKYSTSEAGKLLYYKPGSIHTFLKKCIDDHILEQNVDYIILHTGNKAEIRYRFNQRCIDKMKEMKGIKIG